MSVEGAREFVVQFIGTVVLRVLKYVSLAQFEPLHSLSVLRRTMLSED